MNLGQGIDKLYKTDKNNFGPRAGLRLGRRPATAGRRCAPATRSATTSPNFAAVHARATVQRRAHRRLHEPEPGRLLGEPGRRPRASQPDDPRATCVDPDNRAPAATTSASSPGVRSSAARPTGAPPVQHRSRAGSEPEEPVLPLLPPDLPARALQEQRRYRVSYVGSRGHDQLMVRDLNAPPLGSRLDRPGAEPAVRARSSRTTGTSSQLVNDGKSLVRQPAVLVPADQLARASTRSTTYTWSKCTDYNSVEPRRPRQAGQTRTPTTPRTTRGRATTTSALTSTSAASTGSRTSGAGQFGAGWEFATVFNAFSGRPYTPHRRAATARARTSTAIRAELRAGSDHPSTTPATPTATSRIREMLLDAGRRHRRDLRAQHASAGPASRSGTWPS